MCLWRQCTNPSCTNPLEPVGAHGSPFVGAELVRAELAGDKQPQLCSHLSLLGLRHSQAVLPPPALRLALV